MAMISVKSVWKEYESRVVLEHINLEIEPRAFVALVGPSGCGKTTFLKMLLSEEQPTRGTIEIEGKAISLEPSPDRGVVFQRYSVFPHVTVLGNVMLGLDLKSGGFLGRLFGPAKAQALLSARELLAAVGLKDAERKYPAQLSGGMQQRLALAQALIAQPKVLLLDEPFGALDPGIRAEIHTLVRHLWNDHPLTVIMVTHDLSEAFGLGTRVVVLERRRNEPSDNGRYGAQITKDFEILPKRIAGQPQPIRSKSALIGGQDDLTRTQITPRDDLDKNGVPI